SSSVIIPTKNRPQALVECLDSVSNQTLLPDEIIVVDASDTEELNSGIVVRVNENVKTICLHTAIAGLTHQKNVGVKACSGDIVFFLDDDIVLEKDFIKEIVSVFDDDHERKIGGVCGQIISPRKRRSYSPRSLLIAAIEAVDKAIAIIFLLRKKGNGTFRASGFPNYPYNVDELKRVEFLSGGLTAWRKEIFDDFKFDENLKGSSYNEDVDFSYRVSRQYINMYNPYARSIHKDSPLARGNSNEIQKYILENSYYLHKKNFPR
ncbi:unnamed protein product, partial [marine sediment metagenome]